MRSILKNHHGESLIEILVVMALATIILPAILTGFVSSREGKAQQQQRGKAISLVREAEEATRSVRNQGWASFAVNGVYHPVISSSNWTLAAGSETINGFTRQIVISDVARDSNGAIVTSGGTVDPSSKKAVITVSWTTPSTSSSESTVYLTRYQDNAAYTQTTLADFTAGTNSGTAISNASGGEVILGAGGGGGDWCSPNLGLNTVDLPKSGVANGIWAIEGRVFAGTGDNASGVSFANVPITTTYPPSGAVAGTFDGYKTNSVFGETNYAYLATDNNGKEIVIVNLTATPYTESGYFNAPGNGSGNSIFVLGNIGYVTSGSKLHTFDLSSKSGSRSLLGSVDLAATGNKVYVVGSYAYVALNSTSQQLQVINVSNPASPTVVAQAVVAGQSGRDLVVNSSGTRVYLATASSSSQREMFIIDTSTKSGNRPTVGSYEASGMSPKGVAVVTGNRALLIGTSAEEYQVIDISSESSPTRCGGLNVDSGINGINAVLQADGYAYSYIITGDASSELKIILGGGGTNFYATGGTFISSAFDPGYQTAFNRIDFNFAQPSQTTIQFQIAVAAAVSGSCSGATYSFIGPDKTSSTYFTSASSSVPIFSSGAYQNPGRCFKYKAILNTTDNSQTPVLYDVTVNYSP
ncbi:MAG: hypothetical protein RI947_1289 [Candidatus Parcubacteria bacterium]